MGKPDLVSRVLDKLDWPGGGEEADFRRACTTCAEALGMEGMSLAIIFGSSIRETLCATAEWALRVDRLQFTFGDGPLY